MAEALGDNEDISIQSIEEFYLGWDGLEDGPERTRTGLVEPLRHRCTPRWRSWDWEHDQEGPERERPVPTRVAVLEGCGAGARVLREHQALTVWVDAEPEERERRLQTGRTGHCTRSTGPPWRTREEALAAREGLPDGADVLVAWGPDGSLDMRTSSRG